MALREELVRRILAEMERGVDPDVDAITRLIGADGADVRAVLDALARYHERVLGEREGFGAMTPVSRLLLPGRRLGDFVIEAPLGHGAMGVVYRARQLSLDRPVALKVLSPDLAARDPRFQQRFRREATLAAAVRHPHLAEVYGTAEDGSTLGFAMRLVEGPTLHDVIERIAAANVAPVRRTTTGFVRQCVLLVRALADALAVVHGKGLVHRDVKPANVLLDGGDVAEPERSLAAPPVLVDFGLLRASGQSDLTGARTMLGTPAYASYESLLGNTVDARADVFSLGATLYDLLTSTAPGTRAPATSGLPDARSINPGVDARLAAIVTMALQRDATLRYEHGGAFRDELDRYLRGDSVRALPVGVVGRLWLWARRDRLRAARAGAIALALLLFGSLALSIAVWAIGVSSLAASAVRLEREGDLDAAASAYRRLLDRCDLICLPWLVDEVERARSLWSESGPLRRTREAVAGAFEAIGDLDQGRAEELLARACDRLCEVLMDPGLVRWWPSVHAFLMREIRHGQPEFRQRLAMEAWTNYLIVAERQVVPEELEGELWRRVFSEDGGQSNATREAATAALGAIRTPAAFAAMVEVLHRSESREVLRIALAAAEHQVAWLKKDQPDVFAAIDVQLLEAWVEGALRAGSSIGLDANGAFGHLAWWERNPLRPGVAHRLALSPGLRERVDLARKDLERRWHAARCDPAIVNDDLAVYAGLRANEFDAEIWIPRSDDDIEHALVRRSRDEALGHQEASRIEFLRLAPVPGSHPLAYPSPTPGLCGTVYEAGLRGGRTENWETPPRGGYVKFDRPGHSRLRVRSTVPTNTLGLVIQLEHMAGHRTVLRDQGRVAYRIRLEGCEAGRSGSTPLPWQYSSLTWGPYVRRSPERRDDSLSRLYVPPNVFERYADLDVFVEFVHGTTTWRVIRLDLVWQFP